MPQSSQVLYDRSMQLGDDDFTLFGLPKKQGLDRAELDALRRELQARVHPDRHTAEGPAAQRVAMQWAMRVNQAYQRLKDPLARAVLLCELRGVPVEAESNTAMPAAFLMRQMAWREALADASSASEVEALSAAVAAEERDMQHELTRLLDIAGDAWAAADLVRSLMFVARFRRDIEHRLDTLAPER